MSGGSDADADAIAEALARNPLFGAFEAATRAAIAACCLLRRFPAGAHLFAEGEAGASAFLIVAGEVALDVATARGPVTLGVFGPDDVIGERSMFGLSPRADSARALTDVIAVEAPGADLREIIIYHPVIGLEMIGHLGQRLQGITRPLAWLASAASAMAEDADLDQVSQGLAAMPTEVATVARAFDDMARALKDQARKRDELATARRIQASILPEPWGEPARLEVATYYQAAKSVGGDFFDYFKLDDEHVGVLIADVCGKGVPAALFMAVSRTILRSLLSPGDRPLDEAMAQANRMLATNNKEFMFVTCCAVILNLDDGRFSYANAGHNPPYLRGVDGAIRELRGTGIPLAIAADMPPGVGDGRLAPGETLLLYTDGVTEAHAPDNRELGEDALKALLAACAGPAEETRDRVVAAVEAHAAGAEQSDDVTLVALRRPG